MVVAGSVNVTPRSEAQREATPAARPRNGAVLLPSFADTAQEAMPSVVSITSTDIVKGNRGPPLLQNPFGGEAIRSSSSSAPRAVAVPTAAASVPMTRSTRKSREAPASSSRKTATS